MVRLLVSSHWHCGLHCRRMASWPRGAWRFVIPCQLEHCNNDRLSHRRFSRYLFLPIVLLEALTRIPPANKLRARVLSTNSRCIEVVVRLTNSTPRHLEEKYLPRQPSQSDVRNGELSATGPALKQGATGQLSWPVKIRVIYSEQTPEYKGYSLPT